MFCPNCGSGNDSEQNFCRFCGLYLRDAAISLTTQLKTGDRSASLQKYRSIKRAVDIASGLLVAVLIAGVIADIFFMIEVTKELLSGVIAVFILLRIAQSIIGYLQRQDREISADANDRYQPTVETQPTAQLTSASMPIDPASIVDHTTQLIAHETPAQKKEDRDQ